MTTNGIWPDGGFFPMSPSDSWPDGGDDFQMFAGSDRAYSESPNNSLKSGYSPPPHHLTRLPIPIAPLVQGQPYRVLPNVDLQTNLQQSIPQDVGDSASNSPASVPVHTPPEMNASIDQMLEMNPALWTQSSPGLDQSWEMVPRQSSITSLDSPMAPSQGSYDRITDLYPMMPTEPAMPVQQQPDAAFAAQPVQYPIQQGTIRLSASTRARVDSAAEPHSDFPPSPTDRSGIQVMSSTQPAGDVANFHSSSRFDLDMAKSFPHGGRHQQQHQQHQQQQPWSNESLRDMVGWDAKPDGLFGPTYYFPGASQIPPVTEEQLRRSLSASTSHSLSPEPSPTVLSAGSLDLSAAFSSSHDVPFPVQNGGTNGYVNSGNANTNIMAQQSLFIDTSPLQSFAAVDQYPFPDYVPDPSLISPTTESLPRSSISSVNLSMEPMAEALLPATQGPGFVNPFGGESPTMIAPAQHAPQTSESPPMFSSGDLAHQSSAAQRSGGRQLGSHLDPEKRRDANTMREVGACWSCALQRDKVRDAAPPLALAHLLT